MSNKIYDVVIECVECGEMSIALDVPTDKLVWDDEDEPIDIIDGEMYCSHCGSSMVISEKDIEERKPRVIY